MQLKREEILKSEWVLEIAGQIVPIQPLISSTLIVLIGFYMFMTGQSIAIEIIKLNAYISAESMNPDSIYNGCMLDQVGTALKWNCPKLNQTDEDVGQTLLRNTTQ